MKILVCGGRNFNDRDLVFSTLDALKDITCVMHGCASGAPKLAATWAHLRGIPSEPFEADWETHGRAAGPVRNARMLATKPDLVIAFPGGSGTADMVRRAHAAGVWTMEVRR